MLVRTLPPLVTLLTTVHAYLVCILGVFTSLESLAAKPLSPSSQVCHWRITGSCWEILGGLGLGHGTTGASINPTGGDGFLLLVHIRLVM